MEQWNTKITYLARTDEYTIKTMTDTIKAVMITECRRQVESTEQEWKSTHYSDTVPWTAAKNIQLSIHNHKNECTMMLYLGLDTKPS